MALIDYYSESNYSNFYNNYGSIAPHTGQCIDMGSSSYELTSTKFYIRQIGSGVLGVCYSKIYEATGTAPNMKGIGDPLATSDPIDVTGLPTSFQLVEFTFSGDDQIVLDANGKYYIAFYYNGGNIFGCVQVGVDDTNPTHPGNCFTYYDGIASGIDTIFYLYGNLPEFPKTISDSITGTSSIALQTSFTLSDSASGAELFAGKALLTKEDYSNYPPEFGGSDLEEFIE